MEAACTEGQEMGESTGCSLSSVGEAKEVIIMGLSDATVNFKAVILNYRMTSGLEV